MKISLSKNIAPDNVLDVIPETSEDEEMVERFLGEMSCAYDWTRIVVRQFEAGLMISLE